MNWIIVFVTLFVCARSWRMGGDGFDFCRNPLVPIILALVKFYLTGWNWWALLYAPALWGMIQAFSYGLSAPPHKFWVWVFGGKGSQGDYEPVEIATRATCGFFWAIPAVIFPLLCGGSWWQFGLYVVFLTVANAFWGRMKDVEISERGVGFSVATSILV